MKNTDATDETQGGSPVFGSDTDECCCCCCCETDEECLAEE